MNHAAKTILSPGAAVAVDQPGPVTEIERPDSLFERFAWLYIFCREKVFRDDTRRIIRAFWAAGEPPAGSKVLELGCGPGFYARALAQRFQQISVLGVDSSKELVKYARANPGKLNYASSGIGSPIHMSTVLLELATGTKMVHVPYKGMGAAYGDMLGGRINLSFATIISRAGGCAHWL